MIVLGKSNDDKGTQLELLTRNILSDLGYQNIVRSRISSGGSEVDVSADYIIPLPDIPDNNPVGMHKTSDPTVSFQDA